MQRVLIPLIGSILAVVPLSATEFDIVMDPESTTIEFTLGATMHTVKGTFRLASGTVRFNPSTGQASGSIVIDARSGESGNAKRDRDMHDKVLQSEAHPTIVLIPERVVGKLPSEGNGDMRVAGSVRIGGTEHPLEIPVSVTVTGDRLEIRGQFEVPYVEWGLNDPSKLLLRVAKEVGVAVTTHATITQIAEPLED